MPILRRGARTPLRLAAAVALSALASCSPPRDAPVFIGDAAFAGLRPDLQEEVERAGFRYAELSARADESELAAALAREEGRVVALSPMLAGSVRAGAVRAADVEPRRLYGLAFEDQALPADVVPIRFGRADAARAAANRLLTEAKPSDTIVAIIAGRGAEKAAEAFFNVFTAAERENLPIVEWTESDWSEGSAARAAASAPAWVYLAAPAGQLDRWLGALPGGAAALVEGLSPSERAGPAVRAWVSWDIEASLRDALTGAAEPARDAAIAGRWKLLSTGRKRRF